MWNRNLSLEECGETLRALTELELWYARHQNRRDSRSTSTCRDSINRWTDLYFFSSGYEQPVPAAENRNWNRILDGLTGRVKHDAAILLQDFSRVLEERMRRAAEEIEGSFKGFLYEFRADYLNPIQKTEMLTLHFRNYFAPESPAGHRQELVEGLSRLVSEAQEKRPDVQEVQCATWLNNIPFFYDLFPPEWRLRKKDCAYSPSTGWWGQFIDRKGKIHAANAEYLKQNGEFKYRNVQCICSLPGLADHLSR